MLRALYAEPGDQGTIARATRAAGKGEAGRLLLVHGQWPGEDAVRSAINGAYS